MPLRYPSVTPTTMLLTSVRVRPWSCLCVFCSVGRVTTRRSSSRATVMSGCSSRVSEPLGPLTVTVRPSIVTSTPDGTVMGRRPIRDILSAYQTYARTSPPSCALRACWPVMIPWLVLTMTMPRPPRTRVMSVLPAYTRRPGLLIRWRPETTGTFPSTYLRVRRRTAVGPSCPSATSAMKPSATRMRAISRLVRDAGTTTSVCRAREAFRTRVSMSAIGSEMFIGVLPTRLRDARQLAQERTLPEADAAEREPSHEGSRTPAHEAAVVRLHLVLGGSLRLGDHRLLGHVSPSPRLRGEGHAEEFEKL